MLALQAVGAAPAEVEAASPGPVYLPRRFPPDPGSQALCLGASLEKGFRCQGSCVPPGLSSSQSSLSATEDPAATPLAQTHAKAQEI